MIDFDIVDHIINEVENETAKVEIRMTEKSKKEPVVEMEEESEEIELAIYDDIITNDNSTLKKDFNPEDLIKHNDEEK